jgi:hypothetical protein
MEASSIGGAGTGAAPCTGFEAGAAAFGLVSASPVVLSLLPSGFVDGFEVAVWSVLVDAIAAVFFDVEFAERGATEEELPAGSDDELDCEAGGFVVEEEFSFDFGADFWLLGTRGACDLSTVTLSFPLLTSLAFDVVCWTSFDVSVVTFWAFESLELHLPFSMAEVSFVVAAAVPDVPSCCDEPVIPFSIVTFVVVDALASIFAWESWAVVAGIAVVGLLLGFVVDSFGMVKSLSFDGSSFFVNSFVSIVFVYMTMTLSDGRLPLDGTFYQFVDTPKVNTSMLPSNSNDSSTAEFHVGLYVDQRFLVFLLLLDFLRKPVQLVQVLPESEYGKLRFPMCPSKRCGTYDE